MPYNLQIIRTSDFVRFDGRGKVVFEDSYKHMSELAKACVTRGIDCALVDVRDVVGHLTYNELYELAQAFPAAGFPDRHRLAILHSYNAGERAELFAVFANARGGNIRAFDNYEDAIEWFSGREILRGEKRTV